MHPTEIIEFMIIGSIIAVIIIISLFLNGRWKRSTWTLALVVLLAYGLFFFVRPYWIDAKIDKKVELLTPYLEKKYPNEEWKISTVPHREDGFKSQNPYYIQVDFENEPGVSYQYWVEKENDIYQISYYTNKNLNELEHMENEIE